MVKGEMAAKVLGVVNDSDKTLVLVDQASLADLVKDGNINIDTPVRFTGPRNVARVDAQPFFENLLDLIDSPVYAQSGLSGSTADVARQKGNQDAAINAAKNIGSAITSGWTVSQYSFTPGDSQCNFQIVLTKRSQGFVARVAAKGWIGNFDYAANLQNIVATKGRGAASHMFSAVKNMQGNIQFDWEIGKESPGVWAVEDRVKLPGGISVPLAPLLGGLPLTLDISAALLIHPALTGGNEYSRGGFSISWGGPGGAFETSPNGAVPSGDSGGTINLTYQVTSDQNISAVAPNAMVISYCAPRIELRLDILGPFAKSLSSFGSNIDKIASNDGEDPAAEHSRRHKQIAACQGNGKQHPGFQRRRLRTVHRHGGSHAFVEHHARTLLQTGDQVRRRWRRQRPVLRPHRGRKKEHELFYQDLHAMGPGFKLLQERLKRVSRCSFTDNPPQSPQEKTQCGNS